MLALRRFFSAGILVLVCGTLLTLPDSGFAQQGTFVPTGSLNTSRSGHTATLLNNGTVLIAGGSTVTSSGLVWLASAELYDPATGAFSPAGTMSSPRGHHTATLLNNGMVLIVGGFPGSGTLASAELYDPATGTFSPTGTMSSARGGHAATLLNNGVVLITGGNNGSSYGVLASAELYDPAAGAFSPTGSMNAVRENHTATMLNDGTVLVAGGNRWIRGAVIPQPESYDPATGTFTLTGSMSTADRSGPTTTLLNNGKVLLAGGCGPGAYWLPCALANAELYDPTTRSFTATGSMNTARFGHTATLLNNGTVLVAGGTTNFSVLASAELYDPATGTFGHTGNLITPRAYHTATLLKNGTVLLVAGQSDGRPLASAELYIDTSALIVVSPTSLLFKSQVTGTISAPGAVGLTNNGPTALSIKSIAFSGTNASDFAETDTCGASLAGGASCDIFITFAPTAAGTRSAALNITDEATSPQSPLTVALSGTGQDFSLAAVTPASATVAAGQTANYTVAVSPAGGFNQTVALTCTGGPALSTCAVTPSSVQLNGTVATNVAVSVTTMAALPPLIIRFPKGDYRLLYLLDELLVLSLLIGLLRWHSGRPRFGYGLALLAFLSAAVMMSACGGGSNGGNHVTPPGTYPLVVSGTFTSGSAKLTHNANLTLVVQ